MDGQSHGRRVLAGATAAQAAISFVVFGLPSIGPEIRDDLAISLPALGALLSAVLLGSGVALVASGVVVDRVGARAAVAGGTVIAVAGLLAASFSDTWLTVCAGLVVAGVGSAVFPIGGVAALFHAYGRERRGWALGVRQTAVPGGGVAGAALIPLIERAGGLEAVLLASAVVVGTTGLAFSVVASPQRATHSGLGLRSIWRTPGLRRLLLVAACYIVVLQAALTYVVPAARDFGLSAFAAGATYLILNVAAAASRVAWGKVADRGGGTRRTRTLVEAGVFAAIGAVVFGAALHAGTPAVVAAAIALGVGAFGWNAVVYLTAGELVSVQLAGRSVSVAATVVFVVSALCTPPLGALAEAAGWEAFWLTTAAFAVAGSIIASGLHRAQIRASA